MIILLWNLSAAIRGYMRFYMPTNIATDLLRTPRGLKWAIPVALVAVPAYLFAMSFCAQLATHPGLGWLNVMVLLFFWNGMKFAWAAAMCPFWRLASSRRLVQGEEHGVMCRQVSKRNRWRCPRPHLQESRCYRCALDDEHRSAHGATSLSVLLGRVCWESESPRGEASRLDLINGEVGA